MNYGVAQVFFVVLLLLLVMATIIAAAIGIWNLLYRGNDALPPDYAPRETEKNALPIGDDGDKKLDQPEGGGAVSLTYAKDVTISLSEKSAKLLFGNPTKSNQDMVLRLYTELLPDAEANGIELKLAAKHVVAFAKPDALRSVLQNLVMNAIEHAECSWVCLAACRKFDRCVITVTDNGKGFGDKDVFRPYYSGNEGEENIGLGLYICKSHIEAMNGTLAAAYGNHMMTFTVTLPVA